MVCTGKPSKNIPVRLTSGKALSSFLATFGRQHQVTNACGGRSETRSWGGNVFRDHYGKPIGIRKNRQKAVMLVARLYDKVLYLQLLTKMPGHFHFSVNRGLSMR